MYVSSMCMGNSAPTESDRFSETVIIFKVQMNNNTVAPDNNNGSSGLEEAFTRLALT